MQYFTDCCWFYIKPLSSLYSFAISRQFKAVSFETLIHRTYFINICANIADVNLFFIHWELPYFSVKWWYKIQSMRSGNIGCSFLLLTGKWIVTPEWSVPIRNSYRCIKLPVNISGFQYPPNFPRKIFKGI